MQFDSVIWDVINNQFCSFKAKIARERVFCQNPYNVSGLCLKRYPPYSQFYEFCSLGHRWHHFLTLMLLSLKYISACPLANSSYATIREEEGNCYLFIKTAERSHTPKYLWEKIKLPNNYTKALDIVSSHLEHFPKFLIHRNKQRLTKIHQMLIRMRKLKLRAK